MKNKKRKFIRLSSNAMAFVGLFLVAVSLQGHILQFESNSLVMAYGYFAVRICDYLADRIFPYKLILKGGVK